MTLNATHMCKLDYLMQNYLETQHCYIIKNRTVVLWNWFRIRWILNESYSLLVNVFSWSLDLKFIPQNSSNLWKTVQGCYHLFVNPQKRTLLKNSNYRWTLPFNEGLLINTLCDKFYLNLFSYLMHWAYWFSWFAKNNSNFHVVTRIVCKILHIHPYLKHYCQCDEIKSFHTNC